MTSADNARKNLVKRLTGWDVVGVVGWAVLFLLLAAIVLLIVYRALVLKPEAKAQTEIVVQPEAMIVAPAAAAVAIQPSRDYAALYADLEGWWAAHAAATTSSPRPAVRARRRHPMPVRTQTQPAIDYGCPASLGNGCP